MVSGHRPQFKIDANRRRPGILARLRTGDDLVAFECQADDSPGLRGVAYWRRPGIDGVDVCTSAAGQADRGHA